jgi:methionine--tRNA ligase
MPAHQPIYITTPIFYANDRPHIGHAYTTTICDIYARHQRFAGREVFFLTGTDEHGLKVEKSARERGIAPQALADENAAEFQRVLAVFGLTNDDFIRTTQPRHTRQVQALFRQLLASGDAYLGNFEGWYDEGQEEYYTDTRAKQLNHKSPISGRPLTRAQEQNYYFRLSKYQRALEDHLAANPAFVQPEARRNEVLGRLREGIQDVPISRTNFTWGIPVPGDEKHVIYVWIDALFNYITALGLAEPESDAFRARAKFWPATYHVIGKEILWFHAVIWPALLIALKLPLPRCIYAHSFWISEGQKMSKSLGNFIDLPTIQRYHSTYGLDAWRYYMATQGPLGAQDADFSAAHFHEVYTTDLVNTLGNCASRVTAMIIKYFDGIVPAANVQTSTRPNVHEEVSGGSARIIADHDWPKLAGDHVARAVKAMEAFDLSGGIEAAIALIRRIDGYINATEPFKLAKDPAKKDELGAILSHCAEALRIASLLLWPVIPGKVEELWRALGLSIEPGGVEGRGDFAKLCAWGGLIPGAGTQIQKVALFPRVERAAEPAAV